MQMSGNTTLGQQTLESRGLNFDDRFYWISLGALFGFNVIFNVGFTLALTFFKCKFISHVLLRNVQKQEYYTCIFLVKLHLYFNIQFGIVTPDSGRSRSLVSDQNLSKIQVKEESSGNIEGDEKTVGSPVENAAEAGKSEQLYRFCAFSFS